MDLEIWLVGTPAQVTIALRGISNVSTIVYCGDEVKLSGADAGRVRRYVRTIPAARKAEVPLKDKSNKWFTDVPLTGGEEGSAA